MRKNKAKCLWVLLESKDDNDRLLNFQFEFLAFGEKFAYDELWILSREVVQRTLRGKYDVRTDDCDFEDKVSTALEYVLRRYDTRKGWWVKKNFITTLEYGCKHAVYHKPKRDRIVDYVPYEKLERIKYYEMDLLE